VRGQLSEDGTTRISPNGYHYTKHEGKWRLTHHLTAEKMLGRPLREEERVHFKPAVTKKDRTQPGFYDNPDMIEVVIQGKASSRRRLAQLQARRDEIDAEIKILEEELGAHAYPEQPLRAESL
jgi:hypothetical protein